MIPRRKSPTGRHRRKPAPIRTTFTELLQELSRLTTNDDVVLAVVKNIFHSYRVRLARSHAPVRLVSAKVPIGSNLKSRIRLLRARPA